MFGVYLNLARGLGLGPSCCEFKSHHPDHMEISNITTAKRVAKELYDKSDGGQSIGLANMDCVFRFNDIFNILSREEKQELNLYMDELKSKKEIMTTKVLTQDDFETINNEVYRTYTFPSGAIVKIEEPVKILRNERGHRLISADGTCHYVPVGWVHLQWKPKEGMFGYNF
jgi:hypothetical protein